MKNEMKCMRNVVFALVILLLLAPLVNAAGSNNVSILYGWNGTAFVPVQVTSDGSLKTNLNLTESSGLTPQLNNTYDLGTAALLWANLYVRSIRAGSGPLSLFAGSNEAITILANGNVGIGTNNPQYMLDVRGVINASGILVNGTSVGSGTAAGWSENTTNIFVYNNTAGVKVGIGTDTPTQTLTVVGTVNATYFVGNGENLTGVSTSNASLEYGYNGTNFVPLLTTGGGVLRMSVEQANAKNATSLVAGANGTDLTLTGNLIAANINVTGTTANSTFSGDVRIFGTLYGGSPLKIAGGLNVTGGIIYNTIVNTVDNVSMNINNTLYVNGSNVGIGTASPITGQGRSLQLDGNTDHATLRIDAGNTKDSQLQFSNSETLKWNLYNSNSSSDKLFLDTASINVMSWQQNGNVGIGMTNPGYKLDVNGSINTFGASDSYRLNGHRVLYRDGVAYYIGALDADNIPVNIRQDGSSIITLNSSNVGIGTMNPGERLDIISGHIRLSNGYTLRTTATDLIYGNTDQVYIGSSGKLTVNSTSGNVGIGTMNPGALLDVSGTTLSSAGILTLEAGGELTTASGNDLNINVPNTRSLFIKLAGTTKIAMDNTGNVGIGTTSPGSTLHVSKADADTVVKIGNNGAYDQYIYFNSNSDWTMGIDYSNSNAFQISKYSTLGGANNYLTINASGNVGIGVTSPSNKLQVNGGITADWNSADTVMKMAMSSVSFHALAHVHPTCSSGAFYSASDSLNVGGTSIDWSRVVFSTGLSGGQNCNTICGWYSKTCVNDVTIQSRVSGTDIAYTSADYGCGKGWGAAWPGWEWYHDGSTTWSPGGYWSTMCCCS